jgi:hypothetical protein
MLKWYFSSQEPIKSLTRVKNRTLVCVLVLVEMLYVVLVALARLRQGRERRPDAARGQTG